MEDAGFSESQLRQLRQLLSKYGSGPTHNPKTTPHYGDRLVRKLDTFIRQQIEIKRLLKSYLSST